MYSKNEDIVLDCKYQSDESFHHHIIHFRSDFKLKHNPSPVSCPTLLSASILPFHSFVRLRVRHSRIPLATATITSDFTAVDNDIEKRE
jgi:hypothetical protein